MRTGQTDRRYQMQFVKDLRWEKQNPSSSSSSSKQFVQIYFLYILFAEKRDRLLLITQRQWTDWNSESVGERRSKQEDQVLDVCTAIEESEWTSERVRASGRSFTKKRSYGQTCACLPRYIPCLFLLLYWLPSEHNPQERRHFCSPSASCCWLHPGFFLSS